MQLPQIKVGLWLVLLASLLSWCLLVELQWGSRVPGRPLAGKCHPLSEQINLRLFEGKPLQPALNWSRLFLAANFLDSLWLRQGGICSEVATSLPTVPGIFLVLDIPIVSKAVSSLEES